METMIRPMKRADVPEIYRIECVCFRSPWSKMSLYGELRNDVAHYFVLTEGGKIAGYGGMWVVLDEAHVTNIVVLPEYRRRGYARRLMLQLMARALERGASAMTLEVRENNLGAQQMYGQLGFSQNGYRPRYYEDTGEGALLLWNTNLKATVASAGKIW